MELYFDCGWGISGDRTIASMLDLGVDLKALEQRLKLVDIEGYRLKASKTERNGQKCTRFDVILDEGAKDNNEDRNYYDVCGLIEGSGLNGNTKKLARKILSIAAEAYAYAHDVGLRKVFFHEKGAVDTVVDIVGAAVCLDQLKPDYITASRLADGKGRVVCGCGELDVPVPATRYIVEKYEIPFEIKDVDGEMVTPTGAAIAAGVFKDYTDIASLEAAGMKVVKKGSGAGSRVDAEGGRLVCCELEKL
jgi:uncharacterized protein (DUF111 family)